MENGALAHRREFPAQREMCFSPTGKPPQNYTGSHPVPWERSYASIERTFLSHRKRRARRQEVGCRKTGKKMQCAAPANAARCIGQRTAVHFPVRHRTPHHARPSCIHPAAPEIRQKPATMQSACLHFHHSTEGQPIKNRAAGAVICRKSCKFAVQRAKEVPDVHFHEPIFATNDNRRTIEIQQGVCGKEEL